MWEEVESREGEREKWSKVRWVPWSDVCCVPSRKRREVTHRRCFKTFLGCKSHHISYIHTSCVTQHIVILFFFTPLSLLRQIARKEVGGKWEDLSNVVYKRTFTSDTLLTIIIIYFELEVLKAFLSAFHSKIVNTVRIKQKVNENWTKYNVTSKLLLPVTEGGIQRERVKVCVI